MYYFSYSTGFVNEDDEYDVVLGVGEYHLIKSALNNGMFIDKGSDGKPIIRKKEQAVEKEEEMREIRDSLLSKTDWTQLKDIDDYVSLKYKRYRQELRDITEQYGWPYCVTWPTIDVS